MAEGGEEDLPRDAKIVKTLLKSMGVEDYEPRVVHQFLELWYRYVVDVLTDAQVYSEHAGKASIDSDDIKLAIQSKVNFSFSQPPPREEVLEAEFWDSGVEIFIFMEKRLLLTSGSSCSMDSNWSNNNLLHPDMLLLLYLVFPGMLKVPPNIMFGNLVVQLDDSAHAISYLTNYIMILNEIVSLLGLVLLELARNRNKIPLPKSIAGTGVPLPPEQDTLINPNYQLAITKRRQTSQPEETEEDEESADPNPTPSQNPSVSHEKTDVPQGTPQRVSFPLGAKRPR
ncbi:Transcription initiation factor TFIID subunit 9 [Capsicum annuum]|nr:Transcription initiation factor TFIID subunit 9 [Capsicum annuum]